MKIKSGVSVQGLEPEIIIAIQTADRIWNDFGQELVITSGTEGKHSQASRHYVGLAVDLRTRYFKTEKANVIRRLSYDLGSEYYVLSHKTHCHVQYNGTNKRKN